MQFEFRSLSFRNICNEIGWPVAPFFAPPCTASHLANRCPAGISQSSRLSMISRCILILLVANWESQLKGQRTRTAAADEYTKCIIMFYNHYQKINKISAHYLRSHAHNLTLTIKSSFYYNCNCIYIHTKKCLLQLACGLSDEWLRWLRSILRSKCLLWHCLLNFT